MQRTKEAFPHLNLPQGEDLIDFGLTPFIKVFWYRSQAYALRASDRILTRFARFFLSLTDRERKEQAKAIY
jgi:hypothetical protein